MKKEVIVAILVGLGMGLIITFGVYRVRSSATETPSTVLIEEEPLDDNAAVATILALHSPEDGSVQTETELTVTGETTPNSFIVLFVNNTDYISNADDSGNFSFKVELDEGSNILRVHVLNENGETTVEERLVVVSDAFEEKTAEEEVDENTQESPQQ